MDFITLTIKILKVLSDIAGSYGLGIILLTVIVRMAMWPLSVSQQRSMKQMQTLQPRMKAIQERYKDDPQKMQKKMMEFYKEHNFNPMSGCFPLLIQMPIFILLYSSLMSPQFINLVKGQDSFLFVNSLSSTLRAEVSASKDGKMGVSSYATFTTGKTATVYLKKETLKNIKIENPDKAVRVNGTIKPGEPITLNMDMVDLMKDLISSYRLTLSQCDDIQKAELEVTNSKTRDTELITFNRKGDLLVATVPTTPVKSNFHFDVLALIALFGLTMVFTQKAMMAMNKNQEIDPNQAAMQKSMNLFMPLMLCGTFIFIPIPAGVLIYLISSNIVQIIQTVLINKQLDIEFAKEKEKVSDEEVETAKKIKEKE